MPISGTLMNTIVRSVKKGKWDGWGKGREYIFFIFKGSDWSISRYSRTDRLIQINGINGTKQVRHDQRTSTLFIKVDKVIKNEMIHISNQKIDSDQVNYLHLLTISYRIWKSCATTGIIYSEARDIKSPRSTNASSATSMTWYRSGPSGIRRHSPMMKKGVYSSYLTNVARWLMKCDHGYRIPTTGPFTTEHCNFLNRRQLNY